MSDFEFQLKLFSTVIGAVATLTAVVLSWFVNRNANKKAQKVYFENKIGDLVADALLFVRGLGYEVFDNFKYLTTDEEILEYFNGDEIRYSGVMADKATLKKFYDKICEARADQEHYLDFLSAAYLHYAERYFEKLISCIDSIGANDLVSDIGIFFFSDIHEWSKEFESVIVERLNAVSCRIHDKSDKKWQETWTTVTKNLDSESKLLEVLDTKNECQERYLIEKLLKDKVDNKR